MKLIKLSAVIGVVLALAGCMGCTRVPPGYAGIRVDLYGKQRGVEDFPIVTGQVWYNPFTEEIHVFPTFLQQRVWTKSATEGKAGVDESITFNSIEGAVINVDIQVGYSIIFEKVPYVFVKYRKDIDDITDVTVRGWVRDEFSETASVMKVTDIFGAQKTQLETDVKKHLTTKYGSEGFEFGSVNIIGHMRVDPQVEASISAVIQAAQRALEAQNKVAQVTAEAQQAVEKAHGTANAIAIEAEARANANRLIAASLDQRVLLEHWIEAWRNGAKPPYVVGNANSLITLPNLSPDEKAN